MAGTIKAYKCPECAAPLKVGPEDTEARCQYCNHTFSVRRSKKAPPPEEKPTVWAPPPVSRLLLLLPFVMTLSIMGFVGFVLWRSGVFELMGLTAAVKEMIPEPPAPPAEWDGPTVGSHVDSDAVEDRIGRVREGGALWIAAASGASNKRLWRVGPFGEPLRFAAASDRVMVVHESALLYERSTGKPLASLPLSAPAANLCAHASEALFFVEFADGKGVVIDGDERRIKQKNARRPAWCAR